MLILLFLGVGAAFLLQKIFYQKWWNRKLKLCISFEETSAYEGEDSCLKEVISNEKLLPLPALEVRFSIDRNLVFSKNAKENSSISDLSYKRDIFSFFGHQKIIRTLPFTCGRRGFYCIKTANLVGYDFLFLNQYYMESRQDTQFYVYPRQIDTARIGVLCRTVSGMVLSAERLYPDPFEFSGIREYRQTDPMRAINWKASAKSSMLMVNQYDSTTSVDLTVILDVADEGIWKYEELTEESIRIAASLAERLAAKNMEFRMISNGVVQYPDEEKVWESFSMHLRAASGQVQQMNQALACLNTENCADILGILEEEILRKKREHVYVFISKNQEIKIFEKLCVLAGADNQLLWVIPVNPAMEVTVKASSGMQIMRWETEQRSVYGQQCKESG